MGQLVRMLVWKYTGTRSMADAEHAYKWYRQAPVYKRPIRLWCIKHCGERNYQELLDWLTEG
jgi:hypothetical protein